MFFKKRNKKPGQHAPKTRVNMEPAELLKKVDSLAKQGLTQKQIAKEMGMSTTFTLNNRLVRASQATGKPVPKFRPRGRTKLEKRVEVVEVKRRGKGGAFGVNLPQEPLVRAGAETGMRLSVRAKRGRIVLTMQS